MHPSISLNAFDINQALDQSEKSMSNAKKADSTTTDETKSPDTSASLTGPRPVPDSGATAKKPGKSATERDSKGHVKSIKTIPTMPDLLVVKPISVMMSDQKALDELTARFMVDNAVVVRK